MIVTWKFEVRKSNSFSRDFCKVLFDCFLICALATNRAVVKRRKGSIIDELPRLESGHHKKQ